MKRFDTARTGMVVFVAAMILGGGSGAKADFVFGTPTQLQPPVNSSYADGIGGISADGLELYVNSTRPGGLGDWDIWVAKRETTDADWSVPVNLGPPVNSPGADVACSISHDGLELYFTSSQGRPGGQGGWDIWVTRRARKDADWGTPVNVGPTVNGPADDMGPWISGDGLELYFFRGTSSGTANADIWVTRRETENDPWRAPVKLGPMVNSPSINEAWPSLSADGLLLFFSDLGTRGPFRPGGRGGEDIWVTTRATTHDDWGIPRNLGHPVNSSLHEDGPILSPDGSTLYFSRGPGGSGAFNYETFDIWQASILPVVDFNGDGKVDGKEVLAMAKHWGQNYQLCDIAPFAWGDGVVDVNDLTVLAGYIGQDVNDPTLIAHWALDETAGMTAADSVGENDAMVLGGAAWQPTGGTIGGALAFDGKDDLVRPGKSVLDPGAGPFSVIAWVKGGAPNRVIVSQSSGADWLYLNQYGMLTTDLKASGKAGKSLTSDAHVLDDQWHRVALVWDGTNRALHMDGVEVAKDTQPSLAASSGVLHIGTGTNFSLGATTFWSGLIDDVRIYNRVVQP